MQTTAVAVQFVPERRFNSAVGICYGVRGTNVGVWCYQAGEMDMLKEEGDSTLLRSQGTLTMGLRVVSTDVVYGGTSMSLGVAPSCASTDGARSLSYVPRRSS